MTVCLIVGSSAHAGTIRDDVAPYAYLELGAQTKYASVGRLNTNLASGSLISSGTLIAPDVVLTAAHTISGANSLSFLVGGNTYTASQWTAYPLWTGDLSAGYDLGLIKLDSPVLNVAAATRYTGKKEVGMKVTEVGYGMTGNGLTGATRYDGQKRAGTNTIDSVSAGKGSSARLLWMDFDRPRSSGVTALEYLIARGDSGGGLFVDTKSGPQLVGISSFGYSYDGNVDASYGEQAAFTRISVFNSWIDSMLRKFSTATMNLLTLPSRPGIRANDLFVAVPEPTAALLGWLGLFAVLTWRRFSRASISRLP